MLFFLFPIFEEESIIVPNFLSIATQTPNHLIEREEFYQLNRHSLSKVVEVGTTLMIPALILSFSFNRKRETLYFEVTFLSMKLFLPFLHAYFTI